MTSVGFRRIFTFFTHPGSINLLIVSRGGIKRERVCAWERERDREIDRERERERERERDR